MTGHGSVRGTGRGPARAAGSAQAAGAGEPASEQPRVSARRASGPTEVSAGAACFFAGRFLPLAFLADFFGAAALAFLADFFADFLAFLRRFLGGLLRRFLRGFLGGFLLRRHKTFLGFLSLLAFLALLAFSHRDPPVAADPMSIGRFKSSASARGQSISSILAGDRLSPNREAQSCAPQELTCRRQSAPCIQYCPQQSCPA